jgi:hypothetical protein
VLSSMPKGEIVKKLIVIDVNFRRSLEVSIINEYN